MNEQFTIEEGITNYVELTGVIIGDLEFSHEFKQKRFYKTILENRRISGIVDRIPIMLSEDKMIRSRKMLKKGERVKINGHLQSYMKDCLSLSVFVTFIDQTEDTEFDDNFIYLDGYIGKRPLYRSIRENNEESKKTKDLTLMLLGVNRPNRAADYIPCIVWNKMALFIRHLEVGCHLKVYGRIQSRIFTKKESEEETSVNEVVLFNFDIIEE